ncbi:hypothetical protein E2C01_089314 [Portunus trituberculatus]|uniref:Uncharacterized protein n=1 Tax=Portunus trituberculatus TaxID=210409 RepID=A0A5B7JM30_PORTR|nr:hypothetical protein [Portunus trituberculatus]
MILSSGDLRSHAVVRLATCVAVRRQDSVRGSGQESTLPRITTPVSLPGTQNTQKTDSLKAS